MTVALACFHLRGILFSILSPSGGLWLGLVITHYKDRSTLCVCMCDICVCSYLCGCVHMGDSCIYVHVWLLGGCWE